MSDLAALLDQLEAAAGPADPVPSADGWELVLAENIAYLAGDQRRWQALAEASCCAGTGKPSARARTQPVPAAPSPVIVPAPVIRHRCIEPAATLRPWMRGITVEHGT
jgi:hypothetical protein